MRGLSFLHRSVVEAIRTWFKELRPSVVAGRVVQGWAHDSQELLTADSRFEAHRTKDVVSVICVARLKEYVVACLKKM